MFGATRDRMEHLLKKAVEALSGGKVVKEKTNNADASSIVGWEQYRQVVETRYAILDKVVTTTKGPLLH